MADDLQNWLENRTIRAKPPTLRQRLTKWTRRHAGAVIASAAVLAALSIAAGTVAWWQFERAASRAERVTRTETQVGLHLTDADRHEAALNWEDALSAAQRAEAALAGGDAEPAAREHVARRLADLRFVARLESIRQRRDEVLKGGFVDFEGSAREYAEAFQGYGLDVEASPPDTLVERFRDRPA